jgi:2-polyprenyl-6-methoxyphenol hydroxylase-like FAD-dependent oxidoreductase
MVGLRSLTMNPTQNAIEVLIAGAGPTGLALALWLTRLQVRVRVVDRAAEPAASSRALVVHARILEHYDQLGLADEMVAQGVKMGAVNLWVSGKKVARARLGDMGRGLSPYPFALIYPQDAHERFLVEKLRAAGVRVERGTELAGFDDLGDHVHARLRHADGTEELCDASFIAGCDGAHSRVREVIDAGFPGGTYEHLFYVADVRATGPVIDRELHVALDSSDFLAVFPLAEPRHARLVGIVRDDAANRDASLGWDDVSRDVVERMGITVESVNWFSTYRVHHRVASTFRRGRAFLLGDAAHIHSPVGGQGMNTGIGDAVNLAWKLAAVLHARWDEKILDTYECERRAFACRLVATTDRAFTFVTRNGPIARYVRLHLAPRVIPRIFATHSGARYMFRTISQTGIDYRRCALSAGRAGRVYGGDRLPWVKLGPFDAHRDNYEPLRSLRWQIHLYGEGSEDVRRYCDARRFELYVFPWRDAMRDAGFARNAIYLVRPDGYVASASLSLPD